MKANHYSIKEMFYTLQGEGFHSGRPAVFCRFSGCNLWNGRQEDKKNSICNFCDTDFIGTNGKNGGNYSLVDLAEMANKLWVGEGDKFIVCTGGEPLIQLDSELVLEFQKYGFEVAIETNGTLPIPTEIDWVCLSPKTKLKNPKADELKFVYPQERISPEDFSEGEFQHNYLQPKDGPDLEENTKKCVKYCLEYNHWKLSLQIHKIIGIE